MNELEMLRERLTQNGEPFFSLIDTNLYKQKFFPIKELIIESTKKYLSEQNYIPDSKGLLGLRQEIAKLYTNIDPEQIIITSGSSESYLLILETIVDRNKKILLPEPSYPLLQELIQRTGHKIQNISRQSQLPYQIKFDILEVLAGKDSGALILVSPDNPTGLAFAQSELEHIDGITASENIPIIFDEVFNNYYIHKNHQRFSKPKSNILYLNGASKFLSAPDLKVSWIAIDGPDASKIARNLEIANDHILSASPLNQTICKDLLISLRMGEYQTPEKIRMRISENLLKISTLLKQYPEIEMIMPDGGFHLVLYFNGENILNSQDFCLKLLINKKLYIHPGSYYGIRKPSIVISLLDENLTKHVHELAQYSLSD